MGTLRDSQMLCSAQHVAITDGTDLIFTSTFLLKILHRPLSLPNPISIMILVLLWYVLKLSLSGKRLYPMYGFINHFKEGYAGSPNIIRGISQLERVIGFCKKGL